MDQISSGAGLLIFLLFIVPGFTAIERLNDEFPAKPPTTFDKGALSLIYSIYVHFLLGAWLSFSLLVNNGEGLLSAVLALLYAWPPKPILEAYNFTLQVWRGEIEWLYIVTTSVFYILLSVISGRGLALLLIAYERYLARHYNWLPVWLRAFPRDAAKPLRVRLKNGLQYIGVLKTDCEDYEVSQSSEKDFVITDPHVCTGGEWSPVEGSNRVLINTRDVDAIEYLIEEGPVAPSIRQKAWKATVTAARHIALFLRLLGTKLHALVPRGSARSRAGRKNDQPKANEAAAEESSATAVGERQDGRIT